jgi:hypothetical protein
MYFKNLTASLIILTTSVYANDININDNSFRTTYENVTIHPDEEMGLVGINYLRHKDNFYYGAGLYGAVKGKRGGFFSGGITAGYQYPLFNNILLDAGGFIGGGTGDGKDRFGNGVMIRSHAGLLYDAKDYQVGAALSNVTFPGSKSDSNHISFQLSVPFKTITTNSIHNQSIYKGITSYFNNQFAWRTQYITTTYQQYSPSSKSRKKSGQALENNIALLGFEYGHYFNRNVFAYIEASEAVDGDIAGYAEVLGGIGYDLPLSSDFGLKAKAAVGSGGGSGVDVQGGFLAKANIGLYYNLTDRVTLGLEEGYVDAPDGNFSASNTKFMLSYNFRSLSIGDNINPINIFKDISTGLWRMRVGVERYTASDSIRSDKRNAPVDLMVFKFDRFLNDNFYATGQGFGAIRGDVSGYGGGLLGLGYQTKPFIGNLSAYTELLVGPGGAGGVSAGDGLLVHPMLGLNYKMNESFDFQVGIGHVKSISSGTLDTPVLDAGLVYKFKTIE